MLFHLIDVQIENPAYCLGVQGSVIPCRYRILKCCPLQGDEHVVGSKYIKIFIVIISETMYCTLHVMG
ncbi:hypothetical protein FKM82_001743 [Ascaphus truei]